MFLNHVNFRMFLSRPQHDGPASPFEVHPATASRCGISTSVAGRCSGQFATMFLIDIEMSKDISSALCMVCFGGFQAFPGEKASCQVKVLRGWEDGTPGHPEHSDPMAGAVCGEMVPIASADFSKPWAEWQVNTRRWIVGGALQGSQGLRDRPVAENCRHPFLQLRSRFPSITKQLGTHQLDLNGAGKCG